MIFTPLGPDFPEDLINSLLEGDVVFLCGAGVSAPQLPNFENLVRQVYASVGEERTPAEEHAFSVGRYEEALGALARRLVRADDVIDATAEILRVPAEPDITHHTLILRLSRDGIGRPAVVTTNFDTFFERSLMQSYSPEFATAESAAGQDIPAPGSSRFHGIVHLHGRLSDPQLGLSQTELVLTSAQYGEAYLRAGWAARFLFDLTRCRTLILVGYTASDAPVRYILNVLEGDRERFSDLKKVYALSSTNGNAEAAAAPWQALAVEPLLFQPAEGDAYAPLWTSLGQLADLIENPDGWRRETIARVAAITTANADEHDKRSLKWSLSGRSDLFELFVEHCADPEWFEIVGPEMKKFGNRAMAWMLARWFAREWTNRLRFATAMKYANQRLGNLSEALWGELDRNRPQEDLWERAWQLLADSAADRSHNSLDDFQLRHRLNRPFVGETDLGRVVEAIGPRLQIEHSFHEEELPETPGRLSDIARFSMDVERRDVLRDVLASPAGQAPDVVRLLQRASERLVSVLRIARNADLIGDSYDTTDWGVPSVTRHQQNAHRGGFVPLTELITGALPTAIHVDIETVRRLVSGWAAEGFNLLTRLWMHGLTHTTLYSPDGAIDSLTTSSDRAFWSYSQEFVAITRTQLAGASAEAIARLVGRVTAEGPLRYETQQGDQGDVDWPARARDREIWLRLTAIGERAPLPEAAAALLEDIRVRREYLARQIDDRDQFRGWSSGVRAVQGRTARLLSAQPSERLSIADELEVSRDIEDREGWPEYCREDPTGALAALRARPLDLVLAPRWNTWLQILPYRREAASEETLTALQQAIDLLDEAMPEFFAALSGPLANIAERANALGLNVPDTWWDRLWPAAETEVAPDWGEEWELYDRVINSNGGALAEALLHALSNQREGGQDFRIEDLARLERMIRSQSYAGDMARGACVRYLGFVFSVSPQIVEDFLWPYMSAEDDGGVRLRAVLVEYNSFTIEAETAFSDVILHGIRESTQKNVSAANAASHLVRAIVASFENPEVPRGITRQQARQTLRSASNDIRTGALTIMGSWLEEFDEPARGAAWMDLYGPAFAAIWPRDRAYLSNEVSKEVVALAAATGDAFETAVTALLPYISVLTDDWIDLHDLARDNHRLANAHPSSALDLIWAACKPPCNGRSSDINPLLSAIVTSNPGLAADRRVHKLRLRAVDY
ncbi:SIR2-like protein [Rhizobium sp. PP-WC-1G-195]|nr:SIR2-like protein [Rhizobium sp. PP-WC-1G-195]